MRLSPQMIIKIIIIIIQNQPCFYIFVYYTLFIFIRINKCMWELSECMLIVLSDFHMPSSDQCEFYFRKLLGHELRTEVIDIIITEKLIRPLVVCA